MNFFITNIQQIALEYSSKYALDIERLEISTKFEIAEYNELIDKDNEDQNSYVKNHFKNLKLKNKKT